MFIVCLLSCSQQLGDQFFLIKSVTKSTSLLLIFKNFNIPLRPIPSTIRHARVSIDYMSKSLTGYHKEVLTLIHSQL